MPLPVVLPQANHLETAQTRTGDIPMDWTNGGADGECAHYTRAWHTQHGTPRNRTHTTGR